MFDSLDAYLEAALTSRRSDRQQRLNHIGVAVATAEGRQLVSVVLDNSPASQASLRRGDQILTVNGEPYHPVYSFNPQPPATPEPDRRIFRLIYSRGGAQQEVAVSAVFNNLFDSYRSAVEPSVQQFNMGNKVIGYVRLWGISGNANDLVVLQRIMADFISTNSLIVDLRNAVGYLGPEHLELFLPSDFGDYYSNPMTVIVDQTTAGAAEEFAGELARLERVTSVGSPTAGGLQPELPAGWPLDSTSPNDPQFEAALSLLAGLF